MSTRRVVAMVLAAVLGLPGAGAVLPAQTGSDTETAARALVPLLKSVRQRLQPHLALQPGTLPPSPFTGRQTAIIAVRIGQKDVEVDEKVRSALDRLLDWNLKPSPESADATLFDHWLDHVKIKAAAVRPPGSTSLECDTQCAIDRFTKPGEAFGQSRKERDETRDQLLLEALVDAVADLEP